MFYVSNASMAAGLENTGKLGNLIFQSIMSHFTSITSMSFLFAYFVNDMLVNGPQYAYRSENSIHIPLFPHVTSCVDPKPP